MTYLYETRYDYEYNSARILFEMAVDEYNKEIHEVILLEDGEEDKLASPSVISSLKRMIKKVTDMIKDLIDNIKDKIDRLTLDKTTKRKLEAFEAALKQYPELKDIKIKVRDFKKIDNEYEDVETLINKTYRANYSDGSSEEDKIDTAIKAFGKIAKESFKTVTLDVAYREALRDRKKAKRMYDKLQNDKEAYQKLVDSFGLDGAKVYMSKIHSASHLISPTRFRMKISHAYADNLFDNINLSLNSGLDAISKKTGIPVSKIVTGALTDMRDDDQHGVIAGTKALASNYKKRRDKNNNNRVMNTLVSGNETLNDVTDVTNNVKNIVGDIAGASSTSYAKSRNSGVKNKVKNAGKTVKHGVRGIGKGISSDVKTIGRGFQKVGDSILDKFNI